MATEGLDFIDLLDQGRPRTRQETFVEFNMRKYNRKKHPEYESELEQIWLERCARNVKLYNGTKFRLASAVAKSSLCVQLNIGITCYKDLISTNLSPLMGKQMFQAGLRNDKKDGGVYLANPVGVGSLLLLRDNKFLFMWRATWTGEDAGLLDRPGGHAEPDAAIKKVTQDFEADMNQTWDVYDKLTNELVRDEVFDSTLCEIRDELNIPLHNLSDPLLMGITTIQKKYGRPSLEFLVSCNLTSQEAEALYQEGTQLEADESVGLLFLDYQEVKTKTVPGRNLDHMTDATKAAIELFSRTNW